MKHIILFGSALFLSLSSIMAQGEIDAYRLSQNELKGTARSVSMGGAFGALGGDVSAISINPAGIGVYKNSEIVTTLNFQNVGTKTELNAEKLSEKKFKVNFDNLAFVSVFPIGSESVPFINFGFSYNRLKNFDRKYSMQGDNLNRSLAGYMANRTSAAVPKITNPDDELLFADRYDTYPLEEHDWLSVFGYNAGMINQSTSSPGQYSALGSMSNSGMYNDLYAEEKGAIDSYDFNVGTTFSDIVSVGLSVSVTDINYRLYSNYSEAYSGYNNVGNSFKLENWLETEGSGIQVSAGVIVKPIHELRIGLAYHSPTWYDMTDYYSAEFHADLSSMGGYKSDINTQDYKGDYQLQTPDRWTASLAGVIGQTAILSADYEYTNYGSSMKLFDDKGRELSHSPNAIIENHYKGASTVRLGAEVRFTPRFSGRIGYAWMQSPMTTSFRNGNEEAWTVGSDSHYKLDGDINQLSYGLGYRFSKNFFSDVAFVYKTQKSDLYSFYNSDKASMTSETFQGLLTLGYRF